VTESVDRRIELLQKLRFIWISHPHADHHLGLLSLLLLRRSLFSSLEEACGRVDDLVLVAPPSVLSFIEGCKNLFPLVHCIMLPSHLFEPNIFQPKPKPCPTEAWHVFESIGVTHLTNIKVDHCHQAYGLVLTLKQGKGPDIKIVYSGDTRPCPRLVQEGKGAALLIHEVSSLSSSVE
jgi:ribonuclease Z